MTTDPIQWECGCGMALEATLRNVVVCPLCLKRMVKASDIDALMRGLDGRRRVREAYDGNVFERAARRNCEDFDSNDQSNRVE